MWEETNGRQILQQHEENYSAPRILKQYEELSHVLYCIVLYCILYCIVLYCTVYVLYCTVLYCTLLYCIVLYCIYEFI